MKLNHLEVYIKVYKDLECFLSVHRLAHCKVSFFPNYQLLFIESFSGCSHLCLRLPL